MPAELRFRLLGPLELAVSTDSAETDWAAIGSTKRRTLLAVLLVRAGETVRVDQLVHELWGRRPPESAVTQVHQNIMWLRRTMGDEQGLVLVTDGHGYRLDVTEDQLDVGKFEDLTRRGLAALHDGDPESAAGLLRRGLALWRGNPLSDVPATELVAAAAAALTERWQDAWETAIDAELACGRHETVVAELTQQVEVHPLRERPWRQLMTALHRTGRQAEALATFQRVRQTWVTELGAEPSAELRRLHQQILSPAERIVPRQLPVAPGFVGRAAELSQLGGGATATVVVGGAGVGKSALALHWGALAADRFPDGQLYADLRGFDRRPPLAPSEVLARFLQALGVPVPDGEDERAAVYRTTLADREMLVVLDNARDPDHVRPLLPGPSPAEVLITSRDDMRGLVATHGVHRVALRPLRPADAAELLSGVLGPADGEFAELAALCDHLPLALRIAAANLSARPQQTVGDLVSALRGGDVLAELSVAGDPTVGLRAALDLSCACLPRQVLASLTQQEITAPSPGLDQLVALHLVVPEGPGRYTVPPLVRAYANTVTGLDF
ncbi:AfsR/SARP family transcriptional regulator [Actinophytocola glycyrrhizae]|uniref:BTAD domain-containing putative transcriptional regulator n=1 Tax=Actinophytocola glycyrrhizae TaxID=2044873 RepID=A0ABV9SBI1_9PSEU